MKYSDGKILVGEYEICVLAAGIRDLDSRQSPPIPDFHTFGTHLFQPIFTTRALPFLSRSARRRSGYLPTGRALSLTRPSERAFRKSPTRYLSRGSSSEVMYGSCARGTFAQGSFSATPRSSREKLRISAIPSRQRSFITPFAGIFHLSFSGLNISASGERSRFPRRRKGAVSPFPRSERVRAS